MTNKEKYDWIEGYLSGTLSAQEQQDFELMLKEDPSLQEELELHQAVGETLKGEQIHSFRAVLKNTDKKWQAPESKKNAKIIPFNFRKVLAIAAVLLALVIAFQFLLNKPSASPEQLFADNFEPYKMILNQRSVEDDSTGQNAQINEAVTAYEQGDYAAAVNTFQALQSGTPNAVAFQFYTAISELGRGNSDQAIPILEQLVQQAPPLFIEQSRWYLALAYLQKGEIPNSVDQLQAIQSGAFQYDAAQNILADIQ